MNIKIFQIYYDPKQYPLLDKAFIPYDNTANLNPIWREYYIFRTAFFNNEYKQADYVGYLSWKFNDKTKVAGEKFIEFIKQNPDYDVYYINPFLRVSLPYNNIWKEAKYCHPTLLPFIRRMCAKMGISPGYDKLAMPFEKFCYSNFWVGSQKFWEHYIAFMEPFYHYLTTQLSPSDEKILYKPSDKTTDAVLAPFIMERLFTTFLCLNEKKIKSIGYKYSWNEIWQNYSIHNFIFLYLYLRFNINIKKMFFYRWPMELLSYYKTRFWGHIPKETFF